MPSIAVTITNQTVSIRISYGAVTGPRTRVLTT